MNTIRLVLCDIDGTLLNNKKQLTERTRQAIFAIKQKGILFGIASGRPYAGVSKKVKDWGVEEAVDVLVTMNGAQLYDGVHQQLHRYFMLKKEWIKEILETYAPLDLNPCVYEEDTLFCKRWEAPCARSAENNGLKLVVSDPREYWTKEREKILYSVDPARMSEVEAFYAAHPAKGYRGFKSQADLFEFVDERVSKSYGIARFCELNGFTNEEVAAFGDTTNDIEMLRDCGLGICMANGTDDAKAVADQIAPSNDEDGVAAVLEKMFL